MTRWFEDIVIDEAFDLGSHTFAEDEIIAFATIYNISTSTPSRQSTAISAGWWPAAGIR
jgi:uncharacterized protein YPO0396